MKKLVAAFAALAALATTTAASATEYTLFIHGRTGGTPSGWGYWANNTGAKGINPVPVNYDGTAHESDSNPTVRWYLDSYCTNGNSCHVVCHSNGCSEVGYAYSWSVANNGGIPWSIDNVFMAGAAIGGSELAGSLSAWMTGYNLDYDLSLGTMRGLYNHDVLGDRIGGWVITHAGADYASATDWLFYGNDDTAVAFHSAGGFRNSGSYGSISGYSTSGGTYWDWTQNGFTDPSNHYVFLSRNSGGYGHCTAASGLCYSNDYGSGSGGIVGKMDGLITASNATYSINY
jgi:hypothetical protein